MRRLTVGVTCGDTPSGGDGLTNDTLKAAASMTYYAGETEVKRASKQVQRRAGGDTVGRASFTRMGEKIIRASQPKVQAHLHASGSTRRRTPFISIHIVRESAT